MTVTRTLAADVATPVSAYAALRARADGRASFLLESVVPGERWGRYSILGYRPTAERVVGPGADAVRAMLDATIDAPADCMAARFANASVGFIAYDAVNELHGVEGWPDATVLARFLVGPTVAVFNNVDQTLTIAGPSEEAVDQCADDIASGPRIAPIGVPDPRGAPAALEVTMSDEAYAAEVERAKEHIRAGDAFQIVLARTFHGPLCGADPLAMYRALRVLSPSPYLYFLDFGDLQIAGASPETLVRADARKMTLRPIAGTRRRGATEEEDAALARELLGDPKERAEHVMLIDLARNDAGRVSEAGSVEVTANMIIEKYSHVMHIVSEVTGKPRHDVSLADVARASFPAGTLTGAPKVRATQIIRELERRSRFVYGGAVGYMMRDRIDLAIGIRTLLVRDGVFEVTAGAGIVEGSVPLAEAEETRSKARAALAAVHAAQSVAAKRA